MQHLTLLKSDFPFLREVNAQSLQQTLKDLDAAYRRAESPKLSAGSPRFKKRARPIGIRFPQDVRINERAVYVPKIGWIGFRKDRDVEGVPKNITVSFNGQHWYVAIQTEREVASAVHPSQTSVGIDVGVARFAALSSESWQYSSDA